MWRRKEDSAADGGCSLFTTPWRRVRERVAPGRVAPSSRWNRECGPCGVATGTCLEPPPSELLVGLAKQVGREPILEGHPVTPQKGEEREP